MVFHRNLPQILAIPAVVASLLATAPAGAQGRGKAGADEPARPVSIEVPTPSNAPYMKPLGRLATVLGSIHFLRTLCGDANGDVWRRKMAEILDAQAPGEADRRILVASFNQGYRSFESTYRKCTPAATVAIERYLREGATLSREISTRYGN